MNKPELSINNWHPVAAARGMRCRNHPERALPADAALHVGKITHDNADGTSEDIVGTVDGWTYTVADPSGALCPECTAATYDRALNMDLIAQMLTDGGHKSYVEFTGGGCATIYAGPSREEPGYGPRYALVAGPGEFGSPSYANLGEFGYGLDDDGASRFIYLPASETERSAADRMLAFLSLTQLSGFSYDADQEMYGFTHDGVYVTDARIDETGRFPVKPDTYGLSAVQADELDRINHVPAAAQ